MNPTNAQSKQQLVLHADTKFNYKVNNLIENMKYVLYDANIEFNAEKRAHVKCTEQIGGRRKICGLNFLFFGVDCQEERTTPKDCHTNDVDGGNPCKRSNSNDNNECKKKLHAHLKYYTCIEQESESEKVRTVKREREHNLYFFILVFFLYSSR